MIKKRRAWRKNKLEDVEEAMEDDRAAKKLKRTVDPKDGSLDELFSIDVKGDADVQPLTRRAKARAKLFGPKEPKIPISACEEARIERAERALEVKRPEKIEPAMVDIWSSPKAAGPVKDRTVMMPAKAFPSKPPKTMHQKVGIAPAVIPAHEGQSLNPHAQAYEELVCMATAAELQHEQQESEQKRKDRPVTTELVDSLGQEKVDEMDEAARVEAWAALRQGGADTSTAQDDHLQRGQVKRSGKRKLQAARNKSMRNKTIFFKEGQKQTQRKLDKSVGEVGNILKELEAEEVWQKARRTYKNNLKENALELERKTGVVSKRRRLGRTLFSEESLVVPDVSAVGKGLRQRLQCSAIQDRFVSIVRRGMLPPPPEKSASEVVRQKYLKDQSRRARKTKTRVISPLLQTSLLLK